MNSVMKFSLLLILIVVCLNREVSTRCYKNPIDYTFPQKDWAVTQASTGQYPFVVPVSLRTKTDYTHCNWCTGLIVGKRHVLVVNCGSPYAETGYQPAPLNPYNFLVYGGSEIPKQNASENILEQYVKNSMKVKSVVSFRPRVSTTDNIQSYKIFQDYVNLLVLEEPIRFDDSIGCLPISKLKNFQLQRETEVTSLQYCYDNKGKDHPHEERTYTVYSVVAKRDCGKWGKEEDYIGRRLSQSCILVDDRRQQLDLDHPCQRTRGNILVHNDTYSFTVDSRHSRYTDTAIIDHYPIYYLKVTSELTEKLEWIVGKESC